MKSYYDMVGASPVAVSPTVQVADKAFVKRQIFAALGRGNAVQFVNRDTGVIKVVNAWAPRDDGELLAAFSTGKSKYVDPYRAAYDRYEVRF